MKIFKIIPVVFIVLTAGCAKLKSDKNPAQTTTPEKVIHKELKPTDFSNQTSDTPSDYEPAATEIKTKTGTLKLGMTQFTDVIYNYDTNTEVIQITAHLKIVTKDQKIIAENDIELYGNHTKDMGTANLSQKNRIAKSPIVRAKVTCLNSNDQDEFICDRAVVDFFVLYEKQYFTDQFETVIQKTIQKTTITQPVEKINTEKNVNPSPIIAVSNHPEKTDYATEKPFDPATVTVVEVQTNQQHTGVDLSPEFEIEGTEDSKDSRYQGQVQSTNLQELFLSDIESADQTVPVITEPIKPDADHVAETKPVVETEKPKPTETKIINSKFEQRPNGSIRPYNQAVGFPDKGTLRNATSLLNEQKLLKENAFFTIVNPARERFYSTYEMTQMIVKLGQFIDQQAKDFKLIVGNISAQRGGLVAPHKSHQIGLDVDIAYPSKDTAIQKTNRQTYSVKKTFELFKFAFAQTDYAVDRIFVDRLIIQDLCAYANEKNEFNGGDKDVVQKIFQNIEHVDGHSDHFHMRLKCTDSQPACREKKYKKTVGCIAKK